MAPQAAPPIDPLSPEQLEGYLARIGADRPVAADDATLAGLQLAHLRAVPFENLDIHLGRRIVLEGPAIFTKVVEDRRGGYCYELNSLFGRLLTTIGYRVTMASAGVVGADGRPGPDFDHLALLVTDENRADRPWLVDVGFGESFVEPIPLLEGFERSEATRSVRVRVRRDGPAWRYEEDRGDGWAGGYRFDPTPRRLDEFEAMNRWQQTSPASHFTRNRVCTLLTAGGRVTLAGSRLITTPADGAPRTEQPIDGEPEALEALVEHFGLTVEGPFRTPDTRT